MKVHFLGEDNEKVEIEVLTRSYPHSVDFWDGNWVDAKIKVDIPGYIVQFIANLRTEELQAFVDELKIMDNKLKGKAILYNMEEYIQLEGEINHFGQLKWKGETCFPVGDGAVLNFGFTSDQSYLKGIIKELEAILTAFPVIGKP
ncbi:MULTISPECIES: hypothetical protein [Lysinibacillus]|uniref:Uncharacterized protein n=1 Tax=Lysinibacillus antri TaxID=2498145 RepID=A0A3S0R4M6_9BACI|nr:MULTISPECIES: hypothetical protein [Lysinibacillus]RUL48607.1 hypothetical protein EK386_16690 [Lysinibacillus antri]TSI09724.1 hypothetical protein FJQ64_04950 [Lysinibacillus sp. BW-2-10]